MRIHTSKAVTPAVVYGAARTAGVTLETSAVHASRKRDQGLEIALSGSSNRRPNRSHDSDEYAATWDQWGVFLAGIFAFDPDATCTAYADRDDFNHKTADRFEVGVHNVALWPRDAHGDHTFRWSEEVRKQRCTKCTATQTW